MDVLVALFLFVFGYVVAKFLLDKVPAVAPLSDILAIAIGILVALSSHGFILSRLG